MSDPVTRRLEAAVADVAGMTDGALADYIPQLATVDPGRVGLAMAAVSGRVYRAGDDQAFTIQSVSKPFVHALALAEHGLDAVLARVGVEPSGQAFDAVSLEPGSGRPANPMINAGALVVTALVSADAPERRPERILAGLGAFAGRPLTVDEATYASELATSDHNRGLAHLVRAGGALQGPVEEVVAHYVAQCSVLVTVDDLAVMAATLANGGVNPVTGERVVGEREAAVALAVMATCGMYDASGRWLVRVGLPAKSGVSGCVVAASPGQFGVAAFSPPVDSYGNSVRGVAALERLSREFELDLVGHPGLTAPPVAARRAQDGAVVLELQGELDLAAAEEVLHELRGLPPVRRVVLDAGRVTRMRPVAARLLDAALDDLRAAGVDAGLTRLR